MIHGIDVSRAILAVHSDFDKAIGQRWLLTDGRVYDWWDLVHAWGLEYSTHPSKPPTTSQPFGPTSSSQDLEPEKKDRGPHPRWVQELMLESGIRALPRSVELLGKALDSQEFWNTFNIEPIKGRLE